MAIVICNLSSSPLIPHVPAQTPMIKRIHNFWNLELFSTAVFPYNQMT